MTPEINKRVSFKGHRKRKKASKNKIFIYIFSLFCTFMKDCFENCSVKRVAQHFCSLKF